MSLARLKESSDLDLKPKCSLIFSVSTAPECFDLLPGEFSSP